MLQEAQGCSKRLQDHTMHNVKTVGKFKHITDLRLVCCSSEKL
jgi:hypothetical protein